MNKIKKFFPIIFLLTLLIVSANISYASGANDNISLMERIGQIFKADAENLTTNDTYARGSSGGIITNSDIEKATEFYIAAGNDENTAREKAIQYMLQRDALYQKAISSGYTVTDEEVTDYLTELKTTFNSVTNKEDVYALINQFDSEEEYWNYQFQIYQINLPIEKYIEALKDDFYNSQVSTYSEDSGAYDPLTDFNSYLNDLKDDLVESENYTIYN